MQNDRPVRIQKFHNSVQRYIHFYNIEADLELAIIQTGHQLPELVEHLIPIMRDHYLIHFVRKGSGSLFLPNATYNVSANDCFLIYPQEIANYTSLNDQGWEYYWVGFRGSHAEKYLSLSGFDHGHQVIHFDDARTCCALESLMEEMIAACYTHQDDFNGLELHAGSLLRSFFFTLYTERLQKRSHRVPDIKSDNTSLLGSFHHAGKYVSAIILLIQSSYSEDIRVEEIAASLHLNRNYLTTLFKKETGKSIKQYLMHYRITTAMRMLRETDFTVTSISFQVGFSDPLYFSRLFREQVGQSPTQYRQAHLNG